jgi:hypothetical protein
MAFHPEYPRSLARQHFFDWPADSPGYDARDVLIGRYFRYLRSGISRLRCFEFAH